VPPTSSGEQEERTRVTCHLPIKNAAEEKAFKRSLHISITSSPCVEHYRRLVAFSTPMVWEVCRDTQ